MSAAVGHRIRWFGVWILVGLWFASLAFKWLGDWFHLMLLAAIALVVYELLADDPMRESSTSRASADAARGEPKD